jgi:hypothetical protein
VPRETTAPSSSAPTTVAPVGPSDRELITNTLNAFTAAYGRLDADTIIRLYPTIDRTKLAEGFKDTKSQSVGISNLQISVNGDKATVSCNVHTKMVPTAGKTLDFNRKTDFDLQKQGATWLIVRRTDR